MVDCDRGTDRGEPLYRPTPSPFSRGHASANDPGCGQGSARRGIYAAWFAETAGTWRSKAGGQASLQTPFEEPDFAIVSFLLAVLKGEGN